MLLFIAWLATVLLLVFVAGVPPWLGLIGYVIGAVVIRRYADTLRPASLSRVESALPTVARGILTVVAVGFALLLVLTLVAFFVAWLAS